MSDTQILARASQNLCVPRHLFVRFDELLRTGSQIPANAQAQLLYLGQVESMFLSLNFMTDL